MTDLQTKGSSGQASARNAADARQGVGQVTFVDRRPGKAERDPGKFVRRRRIMDNLLRFGTPLVLLAVWQVASTAGWLDKRFWPPPTKIARAFRDMVDQGILWQATKVTISRLLKGYVLGAIAGIGAGLVLGVWRPLRVAFDPIISALYTVPKLAILPLLLMIFGLGDTSTIVLIALTAFMFTVISTTAAVIAVPNGYLEPAQSFDSSRMQTFVHVLAPAVLPEIFVALRLAAGSCVLVVVGIEFVSGGTGLGYMIWNSWQMFLADRMYVGIVTVSVVGVIFQGGIKWLGRLLTPWNRGS